MNFADKGFNPYQAPRSAFEGKPWDATDDDEATRRAHLGRERTIRRVGGVSYVIAGLIGVVGAAELVRRLIHLAAHREAYPSQERWMEFVIQSTTGLVLTAGFAATFWVFGRGLRQFESWSWWVAFFLMGFSEFLCCGGFCNTLIEPRPQIPLSPLVFIGCGFVPVLVAFLFLSRKTRTIFSPAYRKILERTPHIRW